MIYLSLFFCYSIMVIVHLDADCFYVSVERVKNPRLIGLPVIVGGGVRGVVASASYEARKFGIHAAMPIWKAKSLCSAAVFVQTDMDAYREFSQKLFQLQELYSPFIEKCSIDEGYISLKHESDPITKARELQNQVKSTIGITVSLGLGTNKLVSQIAGKLWKPEGLTVVPAGTEKEFLKTLDLSWLPGFGPKATQAAKYKGFSTIGDIQSADMSVLFELLGNKADKVRGLANGIDLSEIQLTPNVAKSYSEQATFEKDIRIKQEIYHKLQAMLDNVMRKVRLDGKAVKTLEIKLRTAAFKTVTKSISFEPTDNEEVIYPVLLEALTSVWVGHSIRLVGVTVSNLAYKSAGQLDLFNTPDDKITKLLDSMKSKFGENAIKRGHAL